MNFHIITLFPKAFDSYLGESILKRAIEDKKIKVKFYNPREFTKDKHRRIDRKPYGGGPGMVIEAEPVIKAVEAALKVASKKHPASRKSLATGYSLLTTRIIWLSPSGKQFDNGIAEKYSKKHKDIIIICGRYEGVDARVKKVFKVEEVSIGPFVVTGGELPAMVILDAVSRRIPGVLGSLDSVEENRIASSQVYTRPEILVYKKKTYRVPKILLSGHAKKIEEWKKARK
jgi:tRNA (guanine37-N1)-methyltransferase